MSDLFDNRVQYNIFNLIQIWSNRDNLGKKFSYLSLGETVLMSGHNVCIMETETILMSGHNVCFYGKIMKIIPKSPLLPLSI